MAGCGSQQPSQQPELAQQFGDFQMPAEWVSAAPQMRDHLLRVLHFDSASFEVKPLFVFVDGDRIVQGPMNALVTHYTFIHVTVSKGSAREWTASLLMDPDKGSGLTSLSGYSLDVIPQANSYRVEVRLGDQLVVISLKRYENDSASGSLGEKEVFVARYRLPLETELSRPSPEE